MSGYHNHPEDYIYARATALDAHLNHALSFEFSGGYPIRWSNTALTKSWGRCNRKSGKNYEDQIRRALHA